MKLIGLIGCGLLVCSTACEGHSPTTVCPDVKVPAVVVNVRDAQTGVPAARGATLYSTYRSGSIVSLDSTTDASGMDSLALHIGWIGGTYDLRVSKPGYVDWTANNVVVAALPGCSIPANGVVLDAAISKS